MKTKFSLIICLLSFSCMLLGSDIEVRFTMLPSSTSDRLAVSVELRNTFDDKVVLADQNYRFYYDAEQIVFDEDASSSTLSSQSYSDIDILEHINDMKSPSLDYEMGFINFSINLKDVANGGVRLPSGSAWLSVATLYFDTTYDHKDFNQGLIWSRAGYTDDYATAFVHITEWLAPHSVESLDIEVYHDVSIEDLRSSQDYVNVSIGPNPTTDFIILDLDEVLSSPIAVQIMDMGGKTVKEVRLEKGSLSMTIDISNLPSSSYIINFYNIGNDLIHSDKIIVALP